MTPGNLPLEIYRGDTYRWRFVLWADADKTEPVDLANVEVHSEFRKNFDAPILYEMNCIVTLPNMIDAELPATVTEQWAGAAVWDLQLTYPDDFVATILAGPVKIRPDVTLPEEV